MNILFVDQYGQLGGAQQCLLDLIPGIIEQRWNAICAVPRDGPLASMLMAKGALVSHIQPGAYGYGHKSAIDVLRFTGVLPGVAHQLRRLCDEHAVDIVYVNGPRVLAAAAWARGSRPLLFHAHSYLPHRYLRAAVAAVLRWSDAEIIAVSDFVAASLRGSLNPERLSVIPSGVADAFAPKQPSDGAFRVGIIGRIAPEKGQLEFVEMAKLVHAECSTVRFVICGAPVFADTGYWREVLANAAGLPIEFSGWSDNVGEVLSRLDLLVIPSAKVEAASRAALEAFSARVPVAAFASGGVPEIVKDGDTGFLVHPATVNALAARVSELVRNPSAALGVAERARAAWESRYTLNRYRTAIIGAISRAAARGTPMQKAVPA